MNNLTKQNLVLQQHKTNYFTELLGISQLDCYAMPEFVDSIGRKSLKNAR